MSNDKERETWKNNLKGDYWYNRYDGFGNPIPERVQGGRTFSVTVAERRFNEDRAVEELNPFRNGTFSSVKLVDTAEEYEEIVSNPNVRSESEITDLLDLSAANLKKELDKIDSSAILTILKTEVDKEDADYSSAKIRIVRERYKEVVGEVSGNPSLDGINAAPSVNNKLK